MTASLPQARARLGFPVLTALVVGVLTLRCWTRVVPKDLVVLPKPGAVYAIESLRADGQIPLSGTSLGGAAPANEPRLAQGTKVRLLRVDQDALHHPLPRVRILDGAYAGARGYVSRWHLRHATPPGGLELRPVLLVGLLLSALAAAAALAIGILITEPSHPVRSTAPRQAE